MPSKWFSGSDIADILRTLQVWPDDTDMRALFTTQCGLSAAAMKAEFEHLTGRKPFLATAGTRYETSTDGRGYLDLSAPLLAAAPTIVIGDRTLVENTDFYLMPANALMDGEAFTGIQFTSPYFNGAAFYTQPNRIAITGTFGWVTAVPADVWRHGANMAALLTVMSVQTSQDVASISQEGFEMSFDLVGPVDDKTRLNSLNGFPALWRACISRYTRITV